MPIISSPWKQSTDYLLKCWIVGHVIPKTLCTDVPMKQYTYVCVSIRRCRPNRNNEELLQNIHILTRSVLSVN